MYLIIFTSLLWLFPDPLTPISPIPQLWVCPPPSTGLRFLLLQLFMGLRPALEYGGPTRRLSIKESHSSSPSSSQLPIAPELVVGFHALCSPTVLGFRSDWICAGLECAVTMVVGLSGQLPGCVQKMLFLEVILCLWLSQSFCPLFCGVPRVLGDLNVPLRLSTPVSFFAWWPAVGGSVISYLLQEEAFLVRAERCTCLWV